MADEKMIGIEAEELEHAEEAAKTAEDLYKLKLRKTLTYDGVEYSELEFDFDGLTGADSLAIEQEINRAGLQLAVPAFSGEFIVRMCARACTSPLGKDAWKLLSMRDWHRLRAKARNFMLASES